MKIAKLALAASALGLVAAPIAAQADFRAIAPVVGTNEMADDSAAPIVIFGLAALAAGIFIIGDDDEDDDPISA